MTVSKVAAIAALGVAGALAAPQSLGAQEPDFRFSAPRGSFAIRAGWNVAGAGSDVFDFIVEQLTVEKGDFSSPVVGGDFAWEHSPRLALLGRVEYSQAEIRSEFRDFVDLDDMPIEQETRFVRVPVTVGVKLYLVPRGTEVSRFAWVPSPVVPYIGAGVGAIWYRLEQFGDFVDFDDLDIFTEKFESSGWTATGELFAGVNINLKANLSLTLQARYGWARATLGPEFDGFDPIDLSGLSVTVGVDVVF